MEEGMINSDCVTERMDELVKLRETGYIDWFKWEKIEFMVMMGHRGETDWLKWQKKG